MSYPATPLIAVVTPSLSVAAYMVMPVCLVVDDEPSVREYVSMILRREDFRMLQAEDGAQALQMVRELHGCVDLIVSDIQMPTGDGLSLARAVKKSYPAVSVILVSGNGLPDDDFEFVAKPFLPATLVRAVRKLFARRARTELLPRTRI